MPWVQNGIAFFHTGNQYCGIPTEVFIHWSPPVAGSTESYAYGEKEDEFKLLCKHVRILEGRFWPFFSAKNTHFFSTWEHNRTGNVMSRREVDSPKSWVIGNLSVAQVAGSFFSWCTRPQKWGWFTRWAMHFQETFSYIMVKSSQAASIRLYPTRKSHFV